VVQVLIIATISLGALTPFEELPVSVPPDQSLCDPAFTARFDVDSSVTLQGSDIAQSFSGNVCVIITGAPTIDVTTSGPSGITGELLINSLILVISCNSPISTQYLPESLSSPTALCFFLPLTRMRWFWPVGKIL